MRGVVLVEERSAATAVAALARILGLDENLKIVFHEGKADLQRSFVRKITAWHYPADARFVVSRDNDGADCLALKARLLGLIPPELQPRVKVRLVMHELESWYLGDWQAVAACGLLTQAAAAALDRQRKFRDPDRLTNAASLFEATCSQTGKIGVARLIGPHLSLERNRSASFHAFVGALRWAAEAPAAAATIPVEDA